LTTHVSLQFNSSPATPSVHHHRLHYLNSVNKPLGPTAMNTDRHVELRDGRCEATTQSLRHSESLSITSEHTQHQPIVTPSNRKEVAAIQVNSRSRRTHTHEHPGMVRSREHTIHRRPPSVKQDLVADECMHGTCMHAWNWVTTGCQQ
jgi:hypothetical protein